MSSDGTTRLIFTMQSDQNTLVANFGPFLPIPISGTFQTLVDAVENASSTISQINETANSALQAASTAQTQASAAAASASQVASQAASIASQVNAASTSATAAQNSATAAAASATSANNYSVSAATSATSASTQATNAAQSATNSSNSATAAANALATVTNTITSSVTLDPIKKNASVSLSNGNLTATFGAGQAVILGTSGYSAGKYYFEVEFHSGTASGNASVGLAPVNEPYNVQVGYNDNTGAIGIFQNSGNVYVNGSELATYSAFNTATNIVGIAVDFTNGLIWFRVNGGNWNASTSASPDTGTGGLSHAFTTTMYPALCTDSSSVWNANFGGQKAFTYTIPVGFNSWGLNTSQTLAGVLNQANTIATNAAAPYATAASTSATNAASSASAASTSASTASSSATSASNSASSAQTSATNAANSATSAAGYAGTSATQAASANSSATQAQNWATKTTGTVDGTNYSAKYYANQAATTVANAVTSVSATSPVNASINSNALSLSLGTVPVANGGTGLTSVGASGTVLTSNGSSLTWAAPYTESQFLLDVSAGGTFTLTAAQFASDVLTFYGSIAANVTIVVPAVVHRFAVETTGITANGNTITIGTSIAISNNEGVVVPLDNLYGFTCDGANIYLDAGFNIYGTAGQVWTIQSNGNFGWSNPTPQVQPDWNATSGLGQILNKPTLATVATSGSYADLTNKPTLATLTGTVPIANGGTGATTKAAAALALGLGITSTPTFFGVTLNGSTANTLVVGGGNGNPVTYTGTGNAGQPLLSGGANTSPAYGTLGVAYGGTGLTAVGTSGQVIASNGSSLTWVTPYTETWTSIDVTGNTAITLTAAQYANAVMSIGGSMSADTTITVPATPHRFSVNTWDLTTNGHTLTINMTGGSQSVILPTFIVAALTCDASTGVYVDSGVVIPNIIGATAGQVLTINSTGTGVEWDTPSSGGSSGGFLQVVATSATLTLTADQFINDVFMVAATTTSAVNLVIPQTAKGFVVGNYTQHPLTVSMTGASSLNYKVVVPQNAYVSMVSDGTNGVFQDSGSTLPTGGSAGQVLTLGSDGVTPEWDTPSSSGGSSGVSSFNTRTGAITLTAADISSATNGAISVNTTSATVTVTDPTTINGTLALGNTLTANGTSTFNSSATFNGAVSFGNSVTFSGMPSLPGAIAVAHGGTGLTALGSAGQVLTVNSAGTALEWDTPTGGSGTSLPSQSGNSGKFLTTDGTNLSWAAISGSSGGTVTSVALSLPAMFTVSGSPVTASGTLSATLANQTANTVFAGPSSGSAVAPTFRALVAADLPTVTVAKGGTGLTSYTTGQLLYASASGTLAGLSAVASGSVLLSKGTSTAPAWGALPLASAVTGVLPLANGGTNTSTAPTAGQVLQATSTTASAWTSQPYDIGLFIQGATSASEVVFNFVASRAFTWPASLTNSKVVAGIAATASTTFTITRNGTSIGSFAFAASGTTGTFTFTSAVTFAIGDVIAITAPATPDTTLANIAITFAGTR